MCAIEPSTIAAFILAAIAFLSLLVAFLSLLYVPFAKWKNRPILKVEISPDNKADFFVSRWGYEFGKAKIEKEVNSYYIRFRVINIGRSAATRVMAFLEKVETFDSGESVDTYIPLPLLWANSDLMPMEFRMFFPRINPLIETWCDLGFVVDPVFWRDKNAINRTDGSILWLDTVVKPRSEVYLIQPGVFRMTIKIAAENAKPCLAVFKVSVPVKWQDDPMFMFGPDGLSAEVIEWNWEHKTGFYRWWRTKRQQLFCTPIS